MPAFAKDGDRNIIPLSVLDSNPTKSSRPRIKSIYCQDALREHTRRMCQGQTTGAHRPTTYTHTLLINKAQREDGVTWAWIHLIYFSLYIRYPLAGGGSDTRSIFSVLSYKGKLNFSGSATRGKWSE